MVFRGWIMWLLIALLTRCALNQSIDQSDVLLSSSSSIVSSSSSTGMSISSSTSASSSFPASITSSSTPSNQYMRYAQNVTVNLPLDISYSQIAASRDPTQPDRLFYLGWVGMTSTMIYSLDMQTGQQLPSLNVSGSACGVNVTKVLWIAPLTDSIMVYTLTNTSSAAVIVQIDHTIGECMRAWPVNVTDNSPWSQRFGVDEANQQFALFTSILPDGYSVLSLFSMKTGEVITTVSNYSSMPISFDESTETYLIGPSLWAGSQYGTFAQLNSADLSFVKTFKPYPGNTGYATSVIYDQTGTMIVVAWNADFGYVWPNGEWNSFVTSSLNRFSMITSTLSHDVAAFNDWNNIYTAVRFNQYTGPPPPNPWFDYVQSSTFVLPSDFYAEQLAASRDPSEPDRLFYIKQSSRLVYSVDMSTGRALPPLDLFTSQCGSFNTSWVNAIAPLSDSIMVYTLTNDSQVVIVRLNHTTGECVRAWPVDVTSNTVYYTRFGVDERNQLFALFTSNSGLSLFSMVTGELIATNTAYQYMPLVFDAILGAYLIGPNMQGSADYNKYIQLNSADVSFNRSFYAYQAPYGPTPYFSQIFYDQVGTLIALGSQFGYVYPSGLWNSFVSDLPGSWEKITSTLDHDVVAIINQNYVYTGVRFKQSRVRPSSSSVPPVVSSSSSSTASFSSISSSWSGSSTAAVSSTGSAETHSSVFTTAVISGIAVGSTALVCLMVALCVVCRRRIKAQPETNDVLGARLMMTA